MNSVVKFAVPLLVGTLAISSCTVSTRDQASATTDGISTPDGADAIPVPSGQSARFEALQPDAQAMFGDYIMGSEPSRLRADVAMEISLLGETMDISSADDSPFILAEVDAEGETYLVVDTASLETNMPTGAFRDGDDAVTGEKVEVWTNADYEVWDIGAGMAQPPEASDGEGPEQTMSQLLAPGRFAIDADEMARAGLTDPSRQLLVGDEFAEPNTLLWRLAEAFDDGTPVDGDPHKREYRMKLEELVDSEQFGDAGTRSTPGLGSMGEDVEVVMLATTDDEGRIESVVLDFEYFESLDDAQGDDGAVESDPSAESGGGLVGVSMQVTYNVDYDSTIDVVVPPRPEEDRTELVVELDRQLGE